MQNKALIVIDLQNDITKNYKHIIENVNSAIEWAKDQMIHVVYMRHENLSEGTRTFKHNTKGAEFVNEMQIVSENIFTKYKGNSLTCESFTDFIKKNHIAEFYIAGADAVACVKSSCYNMRKENYIVHVLSDCITSYDLRKIPEMIQYYERNGCNIISLKSIK